MAHELESGKDIAYVGATPWHGLGTKLVPDMSIDVWAKAANLDWTANRVEAFANVNGKLVSVPNAFFNARSDNGRILGTATHTDRREEVQPREILAFLDRYIGVDSRFKLDVAGALNGGRTIWATAVFNGAVDVAGEAHQAYLLARTSYDGSSATILQATLVRAVCANTIAAAYSDKRAVVSIRHTVKFDPAIAAKQLAGLAQSVESFKAMGDAMAAAEMGYEQVAVFFKSLLDIPADAAFEDLSTRKQNQYADLRAAYKTSVAEGAPDKSAWAALQSVTRYVDHERTTRKTSDDISDAEARFTSSQFGSGEAMKAQAMSLLLPRIKTLVAA